MRFIEDTGSSFAKERVEIDNTKRPNYFFWTIIILVLIAMNIGSWGFCTIVFGQPEMRFSYRLLNKLNKLSPIEGFTSTAAPRGNFYTPKRFNEMLYSLREDGSKSPDDSGIDLKQLAIFNNLSLRHYLWNFRERDPNFPNFIFGEFIVKSCRPLNEADLFPTGIIVRGKVNDFLDIEVDFVLPSAEPIDAETVFFQPGDKFSIGKSTHSAAVLNVTHNGPDQPNILLAVPLITKTSDDRCLTYKTPTGETLALLTPEKLNIH